MNIQETVERQWNWQKSMNSNYDTMYLAAIAELGELVDSFGFADWKKNPRDEQNILVEAADLFIFVINCAFYADEPINYEVETIIPIPTDRDFAQTLMLALANNAMDDVIQLLFTQYPMAYDYVMAKQALNALRQDHGYKTGDYIKNWGTDAKPFEDNRALTSLLGRDLTYDKMYSLLETQYTAVQTTRLA